MQTFQTATATAVVHLPAGRLTVVAADRQDTTVDVRPANPAKRRDVEAAERTTVDFADGVVSVTTPAEHRALGSTGFVDVTVQVPSGSRLQAEVASAEVRVVGRLGDVVVENAHGDIKVDEAATARLTTQAGDITVGRLTDSSTLRTAKGDLRVDEATAGTLELDTQLGGITVGVAAGVTASLDSGTALGRVRNALASTGGAVTLQIRATTAMGDISAHSL
ncbi:DUF4097 family beta strand repeat-containing protein [Isoptericola sp. NPDC055881]